MFCHGISTYRSASSVVLVAREHEQTCRQNVQGTSTLGHLFVPGSCSIRLFSLTTADQVLRTDVTDHSLPPVHHRITQIERDIRISEHDGTVSHTLSLPMLFTSVIQAGRRMSRPVAWNRASRGGPPDERGGGVGEAVLGFVAPKERLDMTSFVPLEAIADFPVRVRWCLIMPDGQDRPRALPPVCRAQFRQCGVGHLD
jgi:hypothetical protein